MSDVRGKIDSLSFLENTVYITFDGGAHLSFENVKHMTYRRGDSFLIEWKPDNSNQSYNYEGVMTDDCVNFRGATKNEILIVKEFDD